MIVILCFDQLITYLMHATVGPTIGWNTFDWCSNSI